MTAVAFLALGALIGTIVAFSATSLASGLIALLFAFAGGSIIALTEKLTVESRRWASVALLALSTGTLLGMYSGILVREHRLLTPDATAGSLFYVRSDLEARVDAIDQLYETGQLTLDEAYQRLLDLAREQQ